MIEFFRKRDIRWFIAIPLLYNAGMIATGVLALILPVGDSFSANLTILFREIVAWMTILPGILLCLLLAAGFRLHGSCATYLAIGMALLFGGVFIPGLILYLQIGERLDGDIILLVLAICAGIALSGLSPALWRWSHERRPDSKPRHGKNAATTTE